MRLILAIARMLIIAALLCSAFPLPANPGRRIQGDLAEILGSIAVRTRTPIVGELATPLPYIPELDTEARDATQLLNAALKSAPDYAWEWRGRVAYVYHKRLRVVRANFLNIRFERFFLTDNIATFSTSLRSALWQCVQATAQQPCTDYRAAVTGWWPTDLESLRLTPRLVRGASGRDLLIEAANANPRFYSLIVFPDSIPKTSKQVEYAFQHWAWHRLNDQSSPFPFPFSYYGKRTVTVQPDRLLEHMVSPRLPRTSRSTHTETVRLELIVGDSGKVQQASATKGRADAAAIAVQAVKQWKFRPFNLNGLPVNMKSELTVVVRNNRILAVAEPWH